MKKVLIVFLVFGMLGCAKVRIETVKPIKVDINMRVDVYQHVVNDVESINDEIYGSGDQSFNFIFGISNAYASDMSGKARAAISRRKERIGKLRGYFKQGLIGINRNALVEVIGYAFSEVRDLVSAENKDRKIMQEEVANKNKTDLAGVRRVFFEDEYKRAPKGFYFEIYDRKKDTYTWTRK